MKREEENVRQESKEHPGTEPIAQNPNPRANENIRHTTEPGSENADIEDEVGTEITDGEDA